MSDKILKFLKEIYPYVIVLLVVILIKQFIVTPIQVKGNSMDPTLKNGDLMLLNKLSNNFGSIDRFDIVVVDNGDSYIIKRVIALPNETITYKDNKLYINGEYVEEDFLGSKVETEDFEYKNTDNCYFVMGDNRGNSKDSRYLGCFDKSKIKGTTSLTLFPFSRLGFKG